MLTTYKVILFCSLLVLILAAPHKNTKQEQQKSAKQKANQRHDHDHSTKIQDTTKSNTKHPSKDQMRQQTVTSLPQVSTTSQNIVLKTQYLIAAPIICPVGQKMSAGKCRSDFRRRREAVKSTESGVHMAPACIIGCDLPSVCPPGQKPDASGHCRPSWDGDD